MSNIRPQQAEQAPPQSPPPQSLPPGVISVDKLLNGGLTIVLLLLIALVGFFTVRGFWRFAQYKLNLWLESRQAPQTRKKLTKKQQQQQAEPEDEEEEEEPEEEEEEQVIVVKRKNQSSRRR